MKIYDYFLVNAIRSIINRIWL